jgi:hypothetical protein
MKEVLLAATILQALFLNRTPQLSDELMAKRGVRYWATLKDCTPTWQQQTFQEVDLLKS